MKRFSVNVDSIMIKNKQNNLKMQKSKMYWNMLKELANVKPANIPISWFEQYFRPINKPLDPFYSPDEEMVRRVYCAVAYERKH